MNIAGYILTGGKNSRMDGQKKAFLTYKGKTFLAHVSGALEGLPKTYLSVNEEEGYEHLGFPLVKDIYSSIGPLGGLYSGFKSCAEDALLVVPCDTPEITKEIIDQMISIYWSTGKAVVISDGNRIHPLIGIYPKEACTVLEDLIREKQYRVMELLKRIPHEVLILSEDGGAFKNINNPQDYKKLIDSYGRKINYLRVSITDKCNLRCKYCMPAEGVQLMEHKEILTYEEIVEICETMAGMGLEHIKVTGGEPLVRPQVEDLIRRLKEIVGIRTVTLTTNGMLLKEKLDQLIEAGLDGVNISLDTTDGEAFSDITRGGELSKVLDGIFAAAGREELVTKINCVVHDEWEKDVAKVAELARDYPVHIRFIERMPLIDEVKGKRDYEEEIKRVLEEKFGSMIPYHNKLGSGPSEYYSIEGFQGKIGFISAVSHKFCDKCNRIRLTADGKLRLCLQSDEVLDLKKMLREGRGRDGLLEVIMQGMQRKPKEHNFESDKIKSQGMSKIGG